jgi:predicted CopG family antitoxin
MGLLRGNLRTRDVPQLPLILCWPQNGNRPVPATAGRYYTIDTNHDYTYSIRIRRCAMQKKLTITVDEEVYEGLHKTIGPRKISKFVQELVRPHVIHPNLESAYADMAKDNKREKEALEWAEVTFKDVTHETG